MKEIMNKILLTKTHFIFSDEAKLEIGCGNQEHWRADYHIRLDKIDFGQDIVWDLLNGIPLPDNFCSHIYASHTFEHLPQDKIVFVMNECWRVLRKGGELWVIVPHVEAVSAYIPSHLTRFNETSFKFFTGETNPDYKNISEGHGIDIKMWDTIELVKNERPDIHWRTVPRGK